MADTERSPLRIACLCHQSGVGSERVLVRLLSALDRETFDPLVVLPADGPLRGEIEALSIPVHILPLAWWIPATHWNPGEFLAQLEGLPGRVDALAALLAEERIDLVHTHFIVTLEGALAAARLGLPHVQHSRGLFGGGFPPAWFDDVPFFFSVVDGLADAVVCVSEGVAAQAAAFCRTARLQVVYDGFDLDAFLTQSVEDRAVLLARYGIGESARVVACVGGIQRRKGQLDLVEAAALLVSDFPDLVFALAGEAGDAEYLATINARIAELGLERHIRRIGFEPNVRNLLSVSEALVHPSHSEGFGLAILEAMAAGLPVVATRCGGPEEIVEDGLSGFLVTPQSPRDLAEALRRLLSDPGKARGVGQAAAVRARDFSLEETARRTEEVYREVRPHPNPSPKGEGLAESVMAEILGRARQAAALPPGPPQPLRNPRSDTWLSRLRKRFAGSSS